jgi:hypothetical protein
LSVSNIWSIFLQRTGNIDQLLPSKYQPITDKTGLRMIVVGDVLSEA